MTKAFLRNAFLQKRSELSKENFESGNRLIAEKVLFFLAEKPIRTIHIFLPQRGKTEVNTWEIISVLRESLPHVAICIPFVVPGTREMRHFVLEKTNNLIENRWGIPEPDSLTSNELMPELLDVVLLPLLAFDQRGYRVGYGGGFYDRFLGRCRSDVTKVGLSLFPPVGVIEDVNDFDVRMDLCVTPDHVYNWT